MALVPSKPLKSLEGFPGEILDQIFEICIQEAIDSHKSRQARRIPSQRAPSEIRSFSVSVFPRWNGPGVMRTDGINPLPLLFVNKQIYEEVTSLVYSKLENVTFGGYPVQRPDEDPNIRWAVAYSLMSHHPTLLQFTGKVKVHLPTVSEDCIRLLISFVNVSRYLMLYYTQET